MPTVAVVPVKSFATGNRRLAKALSDSEREDLGRSLALHVVETAESAGMLPIVVTADADVAAWATGFGFPPVPDPGQGLDAAATTGVEWAIQARSRWIVLHADLPLLVADDLRSMNERPGDVIAPSADGGTSALGSTEPVEFAYGPGSFHRHLARLSNPRIVTRLGLLHDVDSPNDLASATAHTRRRGLREYR